MDYKKQPIAKIKFEVGQSSWVQPCLRTSQVVADGAWP